MRRSEKRSENQSPVFDMDDDEALAYGSCMENRLDSVNVFVDKYEMRDNIISVSEQYDIPLARAAYTIELQMLHDNGLQPSHIPNDVQEVFTYGLEEMDSDEQLEGDSDEQPDVETPEFDDVVSGSGGGRVCSGQKKSPNKHHQHSNESVFESLKNRIFGLF
jgi:hypothetical protein